MGEDRRTFRWAAGRQSGRWTTWAAVGCGGLVLVAFIVAALLYYMLTAEPPEFKEIRSRRAWVASGQAGGSGTAAQAQPSGQGGAGGSSGQPAPAGAAGATGATTGSAEAGTAQGQAGSAQAPQVPPLEQQVQAIKQAVRQGYRGPVQVVATEDDIARALAKNLGRYGASDVGVKVTSEEILLSARMNVRGVKAPVVVHLHPEVKDGAPRLVVTRALVGRIELPQRRVEELQKRLDQQVMMPLLQGKGGVRVTNITLQPGAMTVQAYVGQGR